MLKKHISLICLATSVLSCGERGTDFPLSDLATVVIKNGQYLPGDGMNVRVNSLFEENQKSFFLTKSQSVDDTFKPGKYRIELDLLENDAVIYSSNFCSEELQKSEVQDLKPGKMH